MFPTQNIINDENSEVNKGKLKCYGCCDASYLANTCRFISTICNLYKKRGYLSNVCKSKNNKTQKQMKVLHTVDILSMSHDKSTTPIKEFVLMKNKARH